MRPVQQIRILLLLSGASLIACSSTSPQPSGGSGAPPSTVDPKKIEVPLPTASTEWEGFLVHDNGATGIWTVESFPVFSFMGCPQIVGLDDLGHCWVCWSYSGKWTPISILEDGKWLGGLAFDDIDPRIEGSELYTGGEKGNLYQIASYSNGALDSRRIAYLPGQEIHTIVAGELDPRNPCQELLVFTRPGGLYELTPTGPDGKFETQKIGELSGRIRQAVKLPAEKGVLPEIAVVNTSGAAQILQIGAEGPRWKNVFQEAMGTGRLALRPAKLGKSTVLYSTLDDGRILRHERTGPDSWKNETIYLGPQGPRGIVSGQFDADPKVETIAIFGYSKRVELLSKLKTGWQAENIFVDRDKGHWLCAAELEGRNNTDEIVGSGYGGRIFLLSRPAGYGKPELLKDSSRNGKP